MNLSSLLSLRKLRSSAVLGPIAVQRRADAVALVQATQYANVTKLHAFAEAVIKPGESEDDLIERVRQLLSAHPFRGDRSIGILSPETMFAQTVRVPDVSDDELHGVILEEAAERLPFDVETCQMRHVSVGRVRHDDGRRREVMLIAFPGSEIQSQLSFIDRLGLVPEVIEPAPIASLRTVAPSTSGAVAVLSISHQSATLAFTLDHETKFLKRLSNGGSAFTQAVAKSLETSDTEARRIRSRVFSCESLDEENEIHRSVALAIQSELEEVSREAELCLRYLKFTFRKTPVDRLILCGSEATSWLAEYFAARLGIAASVGNPFGGLTEHPTSHLMRSPHRWTPAIGGSLYGLQQDAVDVEQAEPYTNERVSDEGDS